VNSLTRRLHVGDGSILAASIVSFSARSRAANHDREVPITSILVPFFSPSLSLLPSEQVCAFYLIPLRRVNSFHWTGMTLPWKQ
jgi:hypothetical protein